MRVFSGRINPDGAVTNTTRDTDEKLAGLFFLQGKEQVAAGQAKAGDIVATAKLKVTATGDTLCAKNAGDRAPGHPVPRAVDLLRHRAQDPGGRGPDFPGDAPDHGGGPDGPHRARSRTPPSSSSPATASSTSASSPSG